VWDGTTGHTLLPSQQGGWRHFEGSNFAFADGHVKWLRPTKVSWGWACPESWYGPGNYSDTPTVGVYYRARPLDDMGGFGATFNYRNND
jgi:prepilin-type processing-associated H-X9-DG protein